MNKYGFIARVYHEKDNAIFPYCVPDVAPAIAELNAYPEYWCIDQHRAKNFLLVPAGVNILARPPDVMSQILFSKDQWDMIIKSFDGHEPEIDILDPAGMGQVFNRTPENLRVKLRVMLDENGNQVKEVDLLKEMQKPKMADNKISKIIVRNDWLEHWEYNAENQILSVSPEYEKNAHEIVHNQMTDSREQMIDRLINQVSTVAFRRVQEYEQRIRQMSDEQIEKEYRMEFGE